MNTKKRIHALPALSFVIGIIAVAADLFSFVTTFYPTLLVALGAILLAIILGIWGWGAVAKRPEVYSGGHLAGWGIGLAVLAFLAGLAMPAT